MHRKNRSGLLIYSDKGGGKKGGFEVLAATNPMVQEEVGSRAVYPSCSIADPGRKAGSAARCSLLSGPSSGKGRKQPGS